MFWDLGKLRTMDKPFPYIKYKRRKKNTTKKKTHDPANPDKLFSWQQRGSDYTWKHAKIRFEQLFHAGSKPRSDSLFARITPSLPHASPYFESAVGSLTYQEGLQAPSEAFHRKTVKGISFSPKEEKFTRSWTHDLRTQTLRVFFRTA